MKIFLRTLSRRSFAQSPSGELVRQNKITADSPPTNKIMRAICRADRHQAKTALACLAGMDTVEAEALAYGMGLTNGGAA